MIIPTLTLEKLGYDSYGNNPSLLSPTDKEKIDQGDYIRISGEVICEHCQAPLRNHPQVQGALWLRRGCPNVLLKL